MPKQATTSGVSIPVPPDHLPALRRRLLEHYDATDRMLAPSDEEHGRDAGLVADLADIHTALESIAPPAITGEPQFLRDPFAGRDEAQSTEVAERWTLLLEQLDRSLADRIVSASGAGATMREGD